MTPLSSGPLSSSAWRCHRPERLTLGGDDLLIGSLEVGYPPPEPEGPSELEDDTAWDKIVILEDSLVRLEKPPPTLPLHMRERARLVIGGNSGIFLGKLERNAEVIVERGARVNVEDWKIHLCEGDERVHLNGIAPFDYGILRRLEAHLSTAGERLLGSYEPTDADTPPGSLTETQVAVDDWTRSHHTLVDAYSQNPAIQADARWLTYEQRRRNSRFPSATWLGLNILLRPLGYGLKAGPPFKAWLASIVAVLICYTAAGETNLDLLGGRAAWWRGIRLWVEAFLLPAGIASLGTNSTNSVLVISGTGLRLARIAVSIPFAALLFALQARLRLPRFSDSRI